MDYAPSPTDSEVLKMPIRQELKPEQMVNVFGYPRDLRRRSVMLQLHATIRQDPPHCLQLSGGARAGSVHLSWSGRQDQRGKSDG